MICQGDDAFGSGEQRLKATIAQAEQSIGARLARLRRELALIRWMLAAVFVAIGGSIPLLMPFAG
jgi:hypothetical protein